MQTHGGKGSTPRPVNKEKFDANWDRIFGTENVACRMGKTANAMTGEVVEQHFEWVNGHHPTGEQHEQKVDSVVEGEFQSATASEDRLGQERCDDRV